MSYFREPYNCSKKEVELDLSNYATKSDLRSEAGVDTSKCAKEVDLASLKSDVHGLDIDELKTVSVNLSNLSYVAKTKLLKILYLMNWLKKLVLFRLTTLVI